MFRTEKGLETNKNFQYYCSCKVREISELVLVQQRVIFSSLFASTQAGRFCVFAPLELKQSAIKTEVLTFIITVLLFPNLTKSSAVSEPQNKFIGNFSVLQKREWTDFEALKL